MWISNKSWLVFNIHLDEPSLHSATITCSHLTAMHGHALGQGMACRAEKVGRHRYRSQWTHHHPRSLRCAQETEWQDEQHRGAPGRGRQGYSQRKDSEPDFLLLRLRRILYVVPPSTYKA